MTDEARKRIIKAIRASGRRMERDKKYALMVYVRAGIMTPKEILHDVGNRSRKYMEYTLS